MLVGVTGNIGSGKSTVLSFLRFKGYPVYDADSIAKGFLKKNSPCYDEIVRAFGSRILGPRGEIETKKLAEIVFSDEGKLKTLTEIVHPPTVEEIKKLREIHRGEIAFVETAVLVEYGWQKLFDRIVVVFATKGVRILRGALKFGIKEVLRRDAFQLPYDVKLSHADYLLCNTKDMLHLKLQVEKLLEDLERG